MKKLPIGIQTFADIRDTKENYIYIDKTDIALALDDNQKVVILIDEYDKPILDNIINPQLALQ